MKKTKTEGITNLQKVLLSLSTYLMFYFEQIRHDYFSMLLQE